MMNFFLKKMAKANKCKAVCPGFFTAIRVILQTLGTSGVVTAVAVIICVSIILGVKKKGEDVDYAHLTFWCLVTGFSVFGFFLVVTLAYYMYRPVYLSCQADCGINAQHQKTKLLKR